MGYGYVFTVCAFALVLVVLLVAVGLWTILNWGSIKRNMLTHPSERKRLRELEEAGLPTDAEAERGEASDR